MVARALKNDAKLVRYIGFLQPKQFKRIEKLIRDVVYQWWDGSPGAPPKHRPAEDSAENAPPTLQLLGWSNGRPYWPNALNDKFDAGTDEFNALLAKKNDFETKFPPSPPTSTTRPNTETGRAGGLCDYSVDSTPLNIDRDISLLAVPDDTFAGGRLGISRDHGRA